MANVPRIDSADDAWVRLLRKVRSCGEPSKPRGLRILELLAHTSRIGMSRPVVTVERRRMGFRFLAAEAWFILTGRNDVASIAPYSRHIASFSNDGHRFDGAYGPKVVDQLRCVVDSLARDADTRQAVLSIWRENPRDSKDVPCTLTVQWLVRGGLLHCLDGMRSSDAWLGWPYDVFNFSMLSAYVLLLLRERDEKFREIRLGTLSLTAGSQHLYVDPKADGATNVPYSIEDVDAVLDLAKVDTHFCDESCGCFNNVGCVKYAPLDLDEFDRPRELLDLLAVRKDRGSSDKKFLAEILGEKA